MFNGPAFVQTPPSSYVGVVVSGINEFLDSRIRI